MEIREPVWCLTRTCPVCDQGSCLVIVACPRCGHLAVACDEEGTFFGTLAEVSVPETVHPSATCLGCGLVPWDDFVPATDTQVRHAGLRPGEYA